MGIQSEFGWKGGLGWHGAGFSLSFRTWPASPRRFAPRCRWRKTDVEATWDPQRIQKNMPISCEAKKPIKKIWADSWWIIVLQTISLVWLWSSPNDFCAVREWNWEGHCCVSCSIAFDVYWKAIRVWLNMFFSPQRSTWMEKIMIAPWILVPLNFQSKP